MNSPVPSLPSFPSSPRPITRLSPFVRITDLRRLHRLITITIALQALTILVVVGLAAS